MDDPIEKSIQQQIEANHSKNLLYEHFEEIIAIDPDFLAALEESLAKDEPAFSQAKQQELVSFATQTFLKRLSTINQFLRVEPGKVKELENIYLSTWKTMRATQKIEATLKETHYPALSRWIADLYPGEFVERLKSVPKIGHIVCAEYSPQLQIDLLKLDTAAIKQPILDIGCGSAANLVYYLRSLGLDAYGIDRAVLKTETYLKQADWFDNAFVPDRWGTIISNMAFSNHLLYTYRHNSAQLKPYLLKFREILTTLLPGGSFHYAPGVPFIEQRLDPAQYQVEQERVLGEIFATKITRIKI
jgi:hypothetical protein